jgi:hypothetical protein
MSCVELLQDSNVTVKQDVIKKRSTLHIHHWNVKYVTSNVEARMRLMNTSPQRNTRDSPKALL